MSDFVDFGVDPNEDLTIEILSEGEKLVMIVDAQMQKSKPKPKDNTPARDMVVVTFQSVDNPDAEVKPKYFVKPDSAMTPNAQKRVKQQWLDFCTAFGLELKLDLTALKISKPRGWVTVEHKMYEGRKGAEITGFLKPQSA